MGGDQAYYAWITANLSFNRFHGIIANKTKSYIRSISLISAFFPASSIKPCVKPAVLKRIYCTFFVCVSLSMASDFSCKVCKTDNPLGEVVYLHSPSTRFPFAVSMPTMSISPAFAPQYLPTLSKWKFHVFAAESSHIFSRQTSS